MCGNLISDLTEQFSKLIFVRKILLHRPCEACENSNTDIKELFGHLWKIKMAYFVFWVEYCQEICPREDVFEAPWDEAKLTGLSCSSCMAFSLFHTYNLQYTIFLLFCKGILDVSSQVLSCRYLNNCTTLVASEITNKRTVNKIFDRQTKLRNCKFDRLHNEINKNCFPSPVPLDPLCCLDYLN